MWLGSKAHNRGLQDWSVRTFVPIGPLQLRLPDAIIQVYAHEKQFQLQQLEHFPKFESIPGSLLECCLDEFIVTAGLVFLRIYQSWESQALSAQAAEALSLSCVEFERKQPKKWQHIVHRRTREKKKKKQHILRI